MSSIRLPSASSRVSSSSSSSAPISTSLPPDLEATIRHQINTSPSYRRLFLRVMTWIYDWYTSSLSRFPNNDLHLFKKMIFFQGMVLGFSDQEMGSLYQIYEVQSTQRRESLENTRSNFLQSLGYSQQEIEQQTSSLLSQNWQTWYENGVFDKDAHRFLGWHSDQIFRLLNTKFDAVENFLEDFLHQIYVLKFEDVLLSNDVKGVWWSPEIALIVYLHDAVRAWGLKSQLTPFTPFIHRRLADPEKNKIFNGNAQFSPPAYVLHCFLAQLLKLELSKLAVEGTNRRTYLLRALNMAMSHGWPLATRFILDLFVPSQENSLSKDSLWFTSYNDLLMNKERFMPAVTKSLESGTTPSIKKMIFAYSQKNYEKRQNLKEFALALKQTTFPMSFVLPLFSKKAESRVPEDFAETALERFRDSAIFDRSILGLIGQFVLD